jgi:hypothetical protein
VLLSGVGGPGLVTSPITPRPERRAHVTVVAADYGDVDDAEVISSEVAGQA